MDTNPFQSQFNKLLANKYALRNRSISERIRILSKLEKGILANRQVFRDALFSDFRKPFTETDITELYVVLKEIRHAKARLRNWSRSQHTDTPLALSGTSAKIIYEGKGVCLIISPWNYPVNLSLAPLVSAIAAGNAVLIKPSELTPHTSAALKIFIAQMFPDNEVTLVEGGKEVSENLLELPFDHIFFTGSHAIGSKVMQAAARNLTSVTLELGGKSPVYVHHDANIDDAAAKINAAKLVNAGQTCVAPDYLIAHTDIADDLTKVLKKFSKTFYNPENTGANSYSSIVSNQHYQRLLDISGYEETNLMNRESRIFPPLVVTDVNHDSPLLHEEVFGPVLPVLKVQNEEEALKIIHQHGAPLNIYIFTRSKKIKDFFQKMTTSGSVCYNECAVQFLNPGLPFGGIHQSGIGRSHGKAGFLAFSNERVIFHQRVGLTTAKLLYPPYNNFKKKIVDLLLKYF